jgi:hypothetical protein
MRPLIRATTFKSDKLLIAQLAKRQGWTIQYARDYIAKEKQQEEIWHNETYQVAVIRYTQPPFGDCMQINIRRRDGNVIFRDWRDFQDIKNQLAGPECEAIELYPAESRLIDTANKYHLWVILDPSVRFPFGWDEGRRIVENQPKGNKLAGHRQRPIPQHWMK